VIFHWCGGRKEQERVNGEIGDILTGEAHAFAFGIDVDELRRTPFFRPRSAENKMDFRGLLSLLFVFDYLSFRASKPFGKERTSHAWHRPSSLSLFLGSLYLPPQAV